MLGKLLDFQGAIQSVVSGVLGDSEEQKRYLASGGRCPRCDARLMNMFGIETTRYYSADGKQLAKLAAGAFRADSAQCPKCGHRWKTYGTSSAISAPAVRILGITETERSEEFFGEDRRVIDNSRSATSSRAPSPSAKNGRSRAVSILSALKEAGPSSALGLMKRLHSSSPRRRACGGLIRYRRTRRRPAERR